MKLQCPRCCGSNIKLNIGTAIVDYVSCLDCGYAYEYKRQFAVDISKNKEEHTMYDSIVLSCRGFTGTLSTLLKAETGYNLSIRDTENAVTHVLENVKPNEIKLVSGKVTMG